MGSERTIDADLLTRVLSEFAHTLARRFEVSEVLYRLAEHVMEILDVAGCGVSVVDEAGKLRPVTAVNELTRVLEATEEAHQEGPCVDAFQDGNVVVVPRLADQAEKWPAWCKQANELGVRAVLGVPLCVNEQTIGAMNLYNHEEREWSEAEIRIAKVLCDMAEDVPLAVELGWASGVIIRVGCDGFGGQLATATRCGSPSGRVAA